MTQKGQPPKIKNNNKVKPNEKIINRKIVKNKRGETWRRCGAIDFVVTVGTIDDAIASLIGRDTRTAGRTAELVGQTRN